MYLFEKLFFFASGSTNSRRNHLLGVAPASRLLLTLEGGRRRAYCGACGGAGGRSRLGVDAGLLVGAVALEPVHDLIDCAGCENDASGGVAGTTAVPRSPDQLLRVR